MLSLVRSNEQNEMGFVKIENRICVALSRARHGFYCIGNFEMLRICNNKWNRIVETAQKADAYGPGLVLTCGKHAANDTVAIEPSDFDLRPSGKRAQTFIIILRLLFSVLVQSYLTH